MHWNCHIKLQRSQKSNDIKFTFFCRRGCVGFVSQEGSEEKEEVGLVRDALGNARTALSFILLITPAWVASTKILHCWHSFPPVPGLNAIGFNYLSKGGKFYRLRAIPWGILHLFVTFSFTLDRCLRLYLTKWTNHSLLEPGQWGEPFEAVKIISGGGGSGGWVRSDARLLVVPVMGGHKSASCNGQHLGGRQCTKIFLSYHSHLKIIIQTVHARKIFALCNQQDLQNIPYHASSNCRDGGVVRCMCFLYFSLLAPTMLPPHWPPSEIKSKDTTKTQKIPSSHSIYLENLNVVQDCQYLKTSIYSIKKFLINFKTVGFHLLTPGASGAVA